MRREGEGERERMPSLLVVRRTGEGERGREKKGSEWVGGSAKKQKGRRTFRCLGAELRTTGMDSCVLLCRWVSSVTQDPRRKQRGGGIQDDEGESGRREKSRDKGGGAGL